MTKRIYRSANGKMVDLGQLILQNEDAVAVGNMNVNARGDVVSPTGAIVEPRAATVAAYVDDQIEYAKPGRVPTSRRAATIEAAEKVKSPAISGEHTTKAEVEAEEVAALSGIAAALARTKLVQQDELTPPNKVARAKTGVSKI